MAFIEVFPLGALIAAAPGGNGSTSAGTNRSLYDTVTGTPAFGAHPDGLAQHSGYHNNTLSSSAAIAIGAAPTRIGFSFRWWLVTSAATAAFQLASALTAGASRHQIRQTNAAGNALQAVAAGGTTTSGPANPVAGVPYWIDVLIDVSGTTHTVDWRINGQPQAQATVALAATTISSVAVGNFNASGTGDSWVSDVVVYDAADYPIKPGYVFDLLPTASGTHNTGGAGNFTDDAAAQVNNGETTSWTKLGDWPPNITDYVDQAVTDATRTEYLEYVFQDIPAVGSFSDPKIVKLCGASFPIGAQTANEAALRIYDADAGVASAEAVWDNSIATNTLEYHCNTYKVRPGGGAWDRQSISRLRARLGFSNDVIPATAWSALLIQAFVQEMDDAPVRPWLGPIGLPATIGASMAIMQQQAAQLKPTAGDWSPPTSPVSTQLTVDSQPIALVGGPLLIKGVTALIPPPPPGDYPFVAQPVVFAAPVASATGTGLIPVTQSTHTPAEADATAAGNVPALLATYLPAQGAAVAAGNTPVILDTLAPAQAGATAAGQVPAMLDTRVPAQAAAVAAGNVPAWLDTHLPAQAAASAAGLVPAMLITFLPGVAGAVAAAAVPLMEITSDSAVQPLVLMGGLTRIGISGPLLQQQQLPIGDAPGVNPVLFAVPVASATGAGAVPVLLDTHQPAEGDTTAAGQVPALLGTWQPSVAAATAAGNTPVLLDTHAPAVAAATAAGNTPVLLITFLPAEGDAVAASAVPLMEITSDPAMQPLVFLGGLARIGISGPLLQQSTLPVGDVAGVNPVLFAVPVAAATGVGPAPTLLDTRTPAEADATAAGLTPALLITFTPGVAGATAAAAVPLMELTSDPAVQPLVLLGGLPRIGISGPLLQQSTSPVGDVAGFNPVLIAVPVAAATSAGLNPVLLATFVPAVAGATAASNVPAWPWAAPVGSATASGPAPVWLDTHLPGVASATGAGQLPVLAATYAVNTMYEQDTFTRSVSNSFGTADTGQVWSVQGTASRHHTDGTRALVDCGFDNQTNFDALPFGSQVSFQGCTVDVGLTAVQTGTGVIQTGPQMRRPSVTDNGYWAEFRVNASAVVTFVLARLDAGTGVVLGSGVITLPNAYNAGDIYTIRMECYGSSIQAKLWLKGTVEPDWMLTATDSTYASSDRFYLRMNSPATGTGTVSVFYDNLYVYGPPRVSASAPVPVLQVTAAAPVAAATAVGQAPTILDTYATPVASATAAGLVPAWGFAVPVGSATAAGQAPVLLITFTPAEGDAVAAAPVPFMQFALVTTQDPVQLPFWGPLRTIPGSMTILKEQDLGMAAASLLLAVPVASATSAGLVPTLLETYATGVASAVAAGLTPAMLATVLPLVAAATAAGQAPVVQATYVAAVASATAAGLTPVQAATFGITVANATAAGLAPSRLSTITPAVASATAAANTPVLQATVLPSVASATAASPVVTLRVSYLPAVGLVVAVAPLPVFDNGLGTHIGFIYAVEGRTTMQSIAAVTLTGAASATTRTAMPTGAGDGEPSRTGGTGPINP